CNSTRLASSIDLCRAALRVRRGLRLRPMELDGWSALSACARAKKNRVNPASLTTMERPILLYSKYIPLSPLRHHLHKVDVWTLFPFKQGRCFDASAKVQTSWVL